MKHMIQPFGIDMYTKVLTDTKSSKHMSFYEADKSGIPDNFTISFIPSYTTEWIICYNDDNDKAEFICAGSQNKLTELSLNVFDHYFGVRFDNTGCYFNKGCNSKTYPVNIADNVFRYEPATDSYEMQLIKDFHKSLTFKDRVALFKAFVTDCKTFCPVSESIKKLNSLIYSGAGTVAELSAESGYSVRHISRLYNKVYGIGAKDFIKMYRFQNVLAEIIANPDRDNSFFIEGTGYSDQAHFQREFKTFTGTTPKQYIKLIKNF
ncbi:helix-turn-helix domain-containing protein [uncultured Treponema sp.]|uniref:helix-turn-helix domain-containing protein n=1 Tax=uncultured Treponema sp. TaxID=162155 RepID=UPI00258D3380|nr:helix-turn-helix domain-containing protein [uncultured Treponema sp.]